jgi:hypothetical protein
MNVPREQALHQAMPPAKPRSRRGADSANLTQCVLLAALALAAVVASTVVPEAPPPAGPARANQGVATQRIKPAAAPAPAPGGTPTTKLRDPFEPYSDQPCDCE